MKAVLARTSPPRRPGAGAMAAFSDDAAPGASGSTVQVVAAFYPLQFVAQRVVGDRASVTNLTQPGAEPHDLEMSPEADGRDRRRRPGGLREGLPACGRRCGSSRTPPARRSTPPPWPALAPTTTVARPRQCGPRLREGHEHGDLDPHFWLDPMRLARWATRGRRAGQGRSRTRRRVRARTQRRAPGRPRGTGPQLRDRARRTATAHPGGHRTTRSAISRSTVSTWSPSSVCPRGPSRHRRTWPGCGDLIRTEGITTVFSERLVSPKLGHPWPPTWASHRRAGPDRGATATDGRRGLPVLMRQNLAALRKADGCHDTTSRLRGARGRGRRHRRPPDPARDRPAGARR